ncbi:hypothetical protein ACJ6WF_43790 [Streptomyces sp. MMS24-I2-30]|uniref:hypothetical protein n=1 Tax=Streptomyces sp. MMS24-I2-30 TaxID=3351564 RepID=UPI003896B961
MAKALHHSCDAHLRVDHPAAGGVPVRWCIGSVSIPDLGTNRAPYPAITLRRPRA